mmetsp:Transcript_14125/g.37778  ORF Transcript_14125/g.37778 Transcript_14125/m.37778 type:complete len:237 (-) Transcript_14125:257-967(-)
MRQRLRGVDAVLRTHLEQRAQKPAERRGDVAGERRALEDVRVFRAGEARADGVEVEGWEGVAGEDEGGEDAGGEDVEDDGDGPCVGFEAGAFAEEDFGGGEAEVVDEGEEVGVGEGCVAEECGEAKAVEFDVEVGGVGFGGLVVVGGGAAACEDVVEVDVAVVRVGLVEFFGGEEELPGDVAEEFFGVACGEVGHLFDEGAAGDEFLEDEDDAAVLLGEDLVELDEVLVVDGHGDG